MLTRLLAAEFGLEDALAELQRTGSPTDGVRAQLDQLGDLQKQIAVAGPTALTSLRSEVANAVAASRNLIQQGRSETARTDQTMTKAEARQAIADVGRDVFGRRVLDPYLHFDSAEDERAYREREERNRRLYEQEMAKGTQEGNQRATAILETQLRDAETHGAVASPDFAALAQKTQVARATLDPSDRQPSSSLTGRSDFTRDKAGSDDDLADALAALRAAGVTASPPETPGAAHGLGAKVVAVAGERDDRAGRSA